jgi:hypothetical protein
MAIGAILVLFSLPAALVCSRGTNFLTQDLHMKLANSKCGQLVIDGRFSRLWAMFTISRCSPSHELLPILTQNSK